MTEYHEFLAWCQANELEFPCTPKEFHIRATEFGWGDCDLIADLCEQGIGPDWEERI